MPKHTLQLPNATLGYINTVLGANTAGQLQPWPESKRLAHYLNARYAFYTLQLLGKPCLLMCTSTEVETPAVMRKHWQAVAQAFAGDVVAVLPAISSYNRQRLIGQQVPFIVPGTQLYLPHLGMVLGEYFRSQLALPGQTLSPVAQLLLLRYLLGLYKQPQPAKAIAASLAYSSMSLSRAINELQASGFAEVETAGREKRLRFTLGRSELWQRARPYLQTPVQKRLAISAQAFAALQNYTSVYQAGESALAEDSLLGEPATPVKAIAASTWLTFSRQWPGQPEGDDVMLELWRYEPGLLLMEGIMQVDGLSLYLSLSDNTDERVAMALQPLLAKILDIK